MQKAGPHIVEVEPRGRIDSVVSAGQCHFARNTPYWHYFSANSNGYKYTLSTRTRRFRTNIPQVGEEIKI